MFLGDDTMFFGARRIVLTLFLVGAWVGCGSTPPVEERPEVEDPPPRTSPPEATSGGVDDDGRTLSADATYTDLLRAARALDDRRDQDSDAGCLLGRDGTGWRLSADLAVAVRPLTSVSGDLDARLAAAARLEHGAPVVVLTRWGAYGEAREGGLVLNAITSTLPPRREPGIVWLVTDAGVFVRSTAAQVQSVAGSVEAAVAALPADVGALFIAAEGAIPLARLAEVLAHVPSRLFGRVALAVPLAAGVRLPTPVEAAPDPDDRTCPDGLPSPASMGSLLPEQILPSLDPLRQGASVCVGAGSGAGAGRVNLGIRIGPDGRVAEACVVDDESDDPALRACLLRIVRGIGFPAPDPSGSSVDVYLPLALSPLASQRQRALCE